jgi:hypothetical protein
MHRQAEVEVMCLDQRSGVHRAANKAAREACIGAGTGSCVK